MDLRSIFEEVNNSAKQRIEEMDTFGEEEVSGVPRKDIVQWSTGSLLKDTAVLFIDMRESTYLTKQYSRKTAAGVYRSFLDCCTRIIKACDGYVRSFSGDSIHALFLNDENVNGVQKAVEAAITLQSAITYILNPKLNKKYGRKVGCGVGVDIGNILVTKTGLSYQRGTEKEELYDLTWVGHCVPFSCKLCHAARSGEIIVSDRCFKKIGDSHKKDSKGNNLWCKASIEVASDISTVWKGNIVYKSTLEEMGLYDRDEAQPSSQSRYITPDELQNLREQLKSLKAIVNTLESLKAKIDREKARQQVSDMKRLIEDKKDELSKIGHIVKRAEICQVYRLQKDAGVFPSAEQWRYGYYSLQIGEYLAKLNEHKLASEYITIGIRNEGPYWMFRNELLLDIMRREYLLYSVTSYLYEVFMNEKDDIDYLLKKASVALSALGYRKKTVRFDDDDKQMVKDITDRLKNKVGPNWEKELLKPEYLRDLPGGGRYIRYLISPASN